MRTKLNNKSKFKSKLSKVVVCTVMSTSLLSSCTNVFAYANPFSSSSSKLDYADEFDKTKIMSLSISVDPTKWQEMLDNAQDEEYISADITINGETITNVGIRPKGNSSLSSIARDDETERFSFKVKFDEYVDGQTWQGLDKLVLNNNYSDATSMKEYISYDIMNYIGVDSSLYSYADISVNNETWGLYLALEDVDSGFLDRTKDGEGELYKPESDNMDMGNKGMAGERPENMPEPPTGTSTDGGTSATTSNQGQPMQPPTSGGELPQMSEKVAEGNRGQGGMGMGMEGSANGVSLVYTDDEISSYSSIFDNAETKTTEEDNKRVIEALKNLNAGTELETYVDVDMVLRYLAAHTVVVNLDSYSSNMAHNYYLYENNGQISMIPWDYNMAFGGFMSSDASSVVNFPIDTPVSGVELENRPMIAKLLEVPAYKETYHKYIQEIIDGYFADGKFEKTVDNIDTLISGYVKKDPTAFVTYEEYQKAVAEFKKLGVLRAESVQGQLDGTVPSTTETQKTEKDKLIDASAVDMSLLGDSGKGGKDMPQMFKNIDQSKMPEIMEIVNGAVDGKLTEEQKAELTALGLTDEDIEMLLSNNVGFGQRERP